MIIIAFLLGLLMSVNDVFIGLVLAPLLSVILGLLGLG